MGKSRSFNRPSRQPETTKMAEVAVAGGSSIDQIEVPPVQSTRARKLGFTLSLAVDKVLGLLSSVPCGITLLVILITCCMIGMVIEQQELETFAKYYAELTPGEKIIYGRLGFFNIYHVWY